MRTVALRTDLYIFHLVSVLHRFALEGTDSPSTIGTACLFQMADTRILHGSARTLLDA